jgi:NTP pyrophosphatase (non-canonical NTP hydrolase)
MTIKEYQQEVDSWIQTVGVRYFSPLTNMAILTEEVGEVARLLARIHGDQSFKESEKSENHLLKLEDELCDVIWVVTCLANQSGIDLTTALQKNFDKKNKRDSERHKNNEKLNS